MHILSKTCPGILFFLHFLQRLESYYKRNYKDYFEFVEGSLKGKEELSESEKGIHDWLQNNK
jgi:hypothetical protein